MAQTDGLLHRIDKIQRHAVRVRCDKTDSRLIRDQPVYILIVPLSCDPLAPVLSGHDTHIRRVCLLGEHHVLASNSQFRSDPAEILHHRLRRISSVKAQIQRRPAAFAHSAETGGESVPYDPRVSEKRILQKRSLLSRLIKDMSFILIV